MLSHQQQRIIALKVDGWTVKQIAHILGVERGQVYKQLSRVADKLGTGAISKRTVRPPITKTTGAPTGNRNAYKGVSEEITDAYAALIAAKEISAPDAGRELGVVKNTVLSWVWATHVYFRVRDGHQKVTERDRQIRAKFLATGERHPESYKPPPNPKTEAKKQQLKAEITRLSQPLFESTKPA